MKVSALKIWFFTLCFTGVVMCCWQMPALGQTVNTIANMNFGSVTFAPTYNARIQLGTDGNVQISGSGIVTNGGENAGQVRVVLPDSGIIHVKCAKQASLKAPSASTLQIQNIEIAVNSGVNFGSGSTCNGVASGDSAALTVDLVAVPDPNILIGGEIVISSPIVLSGTASYSTSGSGTPVRLSIVVQ